jgi:hypothetical protein
VEGGWGVDDRGKGPIPGTGTGVGDTPFWAGDSVCLVGPTMALVPLWSSVCCSTSPFCCTSIICTQTVIPAISTRAYTITPSHLLHEKFSDIPIFLLHIANYWKETKLWHKVLKLWPWIKKMKNWNFKECTVADEDTSCQTWSSVQF